MSAGRKTKMRSRTVALGGIHEPERRRQAFEVVVRAFTNTEIWDRHLEEALWQGRLFDPEHTRVALAPERGPRGRDGRDRVVSVVVMAPRMIRFGKVAVPAMTIGPVGTDDRHRKRGYSAAAMKDASRHMKEQGCLVAYLQGIPDYYWRYGYYPFMAPTTVKFGRDGARKESSAGSLRKMRRADLPEVGRIHAKATAGRTCSAARDGKVWEWLFSRGTRTWLFSDPRVVLDGRGRICGYVASTTRHGFGVREIVVRPDEASCRAALGALVREAKRREVRDIELPLPWDDPLAGFVRQYVGGEFRIHTHATGGALMKIVDFPEFVRRLEPELARRWREAKTALPATSFTLSSGPASVGLTLSKSGVKVGVPARGGLRAQIPERWLPGLVSGYHPARSVQPRKGARVPDALLPVLDILFPAGWPFVYQGDNY